MLFHLLYNVYEVPLDLHALSIKMRIYWRSVQSCWTSHIPSNSWWRLLPKKDFSMTMYTMVAMGKT